MRAVTLIETIVYIGVLTLLMASAIGVMAHTGEQTNANAAIKTQEELFFQEAKQDWRSVALPP